MGSSRDVAAKENSRGAPFAATKLIFAVHTDINLPKVALASATAVIRCSAHQTCLRREDCLLGIGGSLH